MKRALLVLGLTGLVACATVVPEPTMEMAGGDAAALETLREGRSLYVNKCSGCHALIAPEAHSDVEWRDEVAEMLVRKKIRLAPGDREKLVGFLQAANGRN